MPETFASPAICGGRLYFRVAVTSGDNTNVLVARVARDAFGVERVAARIYDPHRAAIYERLGIPKGLGAMGLKPEVIEAIADYFEALRLEPENTFALCGRGAAYHEKADYGRLC